MGKSLICLLVCALVCSSLQLKEDERAKELDREYEKIMGEKVLQDEGKTPEKKKGEEGEKPLKSVLPINREDMPTGFNPHEDLHNEEFLKWQMGEPYMLAKSRAKQEGYVCQQFTLPQNGGMSLKMIGVRDLNACKCACNEERGKAVAAGQVGCNAFAYLAGNNIHNEQNITVNECHMKRHYMYRNDFGKTANPWIFCVQQGPGSGGMSLSASTEAELASSLPDAHTVSLMALACAFGVTLSVMYFTCQRKNAAYVLMDDEI